MRRNPFTNKIRPRTRMSSFLKRFRQRGFVYSVAAIFNRVVPEWLFRYSHMVFYEMDPDSFPSPKDKPDGNVIVDWADAAEQGSEVRRLTYCNPGTIGENLFAVSAHVEGKIAGGFWAAIHSIDEKWLGIRLELEPDQAWLFAARVGDEFRRMGIHSKVLRFMCTGMRDHGFGRQVLAVNPHNVASVTVHEKYASKKLGKFTVLRFLGFVWCRTAESVHSDRSVSWNCKQNPIVVRFKHGLFTMRGRPN